MAPRSRRFIFRSVQGKRRFNFVWDAIKLESPVIMTAAQFQFSGGVFGAAGRPVLGNPGQEPKVYVTNIGPHGAPGGEAGGVEFLVHAESNTPIPVVVTVTVLDPVENVDVFD